jgi:pimeloyl-ACP methyl ester carboxylesterase
MTRPLLLAALLICLPGCVIARFYATEWPAPVEALTVTTHDGWTLDLRHVAATGTPRHPRPVVLLHGIVTNGRNVDLDPTHSLARDLSRRGFDVWVPSLRGTGASEKRPLSGVADDTDFDAYVTEDLPAIIAEVKRLTGVEAVDFVGHSLGGLILYAHLVRGGGGIARAVTLGSPVHLRWSGKLEEFARTGSGLAAYASWMPIATAVKSTLPLQGAYAGPVERMLINPENVTIDVWQRFLAVGVDDVPSGLAVQAAGWVARGCFDSRDHALDYLAGLRRVTVPILVVAGKVDGIAPPWAVRPAFEALGSPEKRWLLLAEANGLRADYNHMDMLLGDHAPDELFRHVAAFLDP